MTLTRSCFHRRLTPVLKTMTRIHHNPKDHDGSSSLYLAPPPHGHRRKGSIATMSSIGSSSTTEQDADDNSSFRLSPLRCAHSDIASTLPSPTHTHVDTTSDVGLRPSSVASFFQKQCIASGGRHHLLVVKQAQPRIRREVTDRRQTPSAKELNSHVL
jgi:hypothetical protein